MRISKSFPLVDYTAFKAQLYAYTATHSPVAFYDSNQNSERFDALVGWLPKSEILSEYPTSFQRLQQHRDQHRDWLLGFLCYDLKNELEKLESPKPKGLYWPTLYFFQPHKVVIVHDKQAHFHYSEEFAAEISMDFERIQQTQPLDKTYIHPINWSTRSSKSDYFNQFEVIQNHLTRGDIYEVNYCQEFYSQVENFAPHLAFTALNSIAKAPFSCYFNYQSHYLMCASPERYLQKTERQLLSQPIKGTTSRGKTAEEDHALLRALQNNPKERSENIMIVDLVRNDLARTAAKDSVQVTELCGGYRFNNVQHLISSITSTIKDKTPTIEALSTTFPMGSMTGAPKVRAMEIASKCEPFYRGLYSGAVGYFTPNDDFDFNVVIRSLQYNARENYLSYAVGSAITAASTAEQEYQECLLKAINILRALNP